MRKNEAKIKSTSSSTCLAHTWLLSCQLTRSKSSSPRISTTFKSLKIAKLQLFASTLRSTVPRKVVATKSVLQQPIKSSFSMKAISHQVLCNLKKICVSPKPRVTWLARSHFSSSGMATISICPANAPMLSWVNKMERCCISLTMNPKVSLFSSLTHFRATNDDSLQRQVSCGT